jgi:hypothetical protein
MRATSPYRKPAAQGVPLRIDAAHGERRPEQGRGIRRPSRCCADGCSPSSVRRGLDSGNVCEVDAERTGYIGTGSYHGGGVDHRSTRAALIIGGQNAGADRRSSGWTRQHRADGTQAAVDAERQARPIMPRPGPSMYTRQRAQADRGDTEHRPDAEAGRDSPVLADNLRSRGGRRANAHEGAIPSMAPPPSRPAVRQPFTRPRPPATS